MKKKNYLLRNKLQLQFPYKFKNHNPDGQKII